jgi:hypothetical protein
MKDQRVAQLKKATKARGKIEIEDIIKEELPDQQNQDTVILDHTVDFT